MMKYLKVKGISDEFNTLIINNILKSTINFKSFVSANAEKHIPSFDYFHTIYKAHSLSADIVLINMSEGFNFNQSLLYI